MIGDDHLGMVEGVLYFGDEEIAMSRVFDKITVSTVGHGGAASKTKPAREKKRGKAKQLRCYTSHEALPICEGLVVYGGSCSRPIIEGADIYIGFDPSATPQFTQYPWVDAPLKVGLDIYFPIPDMGVPKDVKNFKAMVVWAAEQIRAGKKVHAGCIGGHGRTGLFFTALVTYMAGEKKAIQYVRNNYCKRAVESKPQIDFLVRHYGVKAAKPTKARGTGSLGTGGLISTGGYHSRGGRVWS